MRWWLIIFYTKQDLLAKGFSLPTLSTVEYSSGYLLFMCYSTICFYGRRACQRSKTCNEHGASSQSSPKLSRMLITRPICIQWKFTTLTIEVLLIKILLFFSTTEKSGHLFQSNQHVQAIEFVDRPVPEKL